MRRSGAGQRMPRREMARRGTKICRDVRRTSMPTHIVQTPHLRIGMAHAHVHMLHLCAGAHRFPCTSNSCAHHACAQHSYARAYVCHAPHPCTSCLCPTFLRAGMRMPRTTSVCLPVHVSMTRTGKHTRSMQWVSAPGSRSKSLWHSHNTAVGQRHIHQLRRSGFPLRPPDARPRTRFAIFRRRHQPCLAFHRGFFLLMT